LNLDTWPDGSLPRDPIDISRLIDRWGQLGLPLMVIITNPSQLAGDPQAEHGLGVSAWSTGAKSPAEGQKNEALLRLLLAKPTVHAIIWNQTSDQLPHGFANAGLWDARGKAKSILNSAAKLRQAYLH
jgi:hypothetical protein